jgi:hypothetical protein
VVIENEDQLKDALSDLNAAMKKQEALMLEHGLNDLQADIEALKEETTAFAVEHEIDRIDLDDCHFTLISQAFDTRFIGTKDEMPLNVKDGRKLKPLRAIIFKKYKNDKAKAREVWKKVTKRVVVKELVDEAVSEGLLTVKEITPSFIERQKKPYLRRFDDD